VAHHGLYRVVTNEGASYASTDDATTAYAEFWFKALMSESSTSTDTCHGAIQNNPQEHWTRPQATRQSHDSTQSPILALGTE